MHATQLLLLPLAAAATLALPQAATPSSSSSASVSSATSSAAAATASSTTDTSTTSNSLGKPIPYQIGPYGLNNAQCESLTLDVPINSTNFVYQNVNETYGNQSYVTGTLLDTATDMKAWAASHLLMNETFTLNKTYSIAATYCTPQNGARENASLPILTHGVSFDSSYWDFQLNGSEYSVQSQLASWGYPSLRYDRLGCGNSSRPNAGFNETQAATEVSIYKSILNIARNSTTIGNKKHERVTGIGHSFGSIINQAVSATEPELLDGIVLTGYSAYTGAVQTFTAAGTFTIARETGRSKYANYPSEWLVTGSATALMFDFFRPPSGPTGNHAERAFNLSREAEGPVTLGTLTSLATVGGKAADFDKPVFVVTGAADLPFCGGNCSAITPSLEDGVKEMYPAANLTVFTPNNTGHGIVAHYSGPLAAQRIAQFLIHIGL